MDAPYNLSKINLWLSLGGATVPISSARVDYELNTIPAATVSVPLGRDARTLDPAPFQAFLDSGAVVKAEILGRLAFASGSDKAKAFGIPDGAFTLFSGYAGGTGYSREPDSSSYQLELRHWLSDLDFSSMFSSQGVPSNPARYNAAACLPSETSGAAIVRGVADYGKSITAARIQADLWGESLRPFFVLLAKQDGLQVVEQGLFSGYLPNGEALAALRRMNSEPSLALGTAIESNVAGLIADELNLMLTSNAEAFSHTFWDLIAGPLRSEFDFAIVPRPRDALVVPFLPTLKQAMLTIKADEYVAAKIQGSVPRPLAAVGLLSGMQHSTGAGPNTGQELNDLRAGGWYRNKKVKKGMVLIARGPAWLEKLTATRESNIAAAAGLFGNLAALADRPKAAGPPDKKLKAKVAAVAKSANVVLSGYAKARYAHELDRARQGFVAGPFRLDIAPGAIVELEPDGKQFLNASQFTSFFGAVVRTSLLLDADNCKGGASFHLSHCRTKSEQQDPSRTMAQHPLYAKSFSGAGLLANPAPRG